MAWPYVAPILLLLCSKVFMTLTFSITYLGASIRWNHLAAVPRLGLAVFFAFYDWS